MRVAREGQGKVVGGILVRLGILAIVDGVRLHALGAVPGGVALMDQLTLDPMEAIRTGDRVRVDLPARRGRSQARREVRPSTEE